MASGAYQGLVVWQERSADLDVNITGQGSRYTPAALLDRRFDVDHIARRGLHLERLDQLVVELLLGVR